MDDLSLDLLKETTWFWYSLSLQEGITIDVWEAIANSLVYYRLHLSASGLLINEILKFNFINYSFHVNDVILIKKKILKRKT